MASVTKRCPGDDGHDWNSAARRAAQHDGRQRLCRRCLPETGNVTSD